MALNPLATKCNMPYGQFRRTIKPQVSTLWHMIQSNAAHQTETYWSSVLSHLQWGFHTLWISADLKMSWTTLPTSTSAQRRASQWECGRLLVVLEVHQYLKMRQVAFEWLEASFGSTRPTLKSWSISWNTTVFLCDIQSSLFTSLSLCPGVSKAHAPCQPMGCSRWEKSRLVPRGPGRWASCYYLPPWKRRDQVGLSAVGYTSLKWT